MHRSIDVANFFIDLTCSKEEGYITNLKVNKLLYFAQAWSYVRNNRPLFDENIEAWQYGPVVPSVYSTFKHYGRNNIAEVSEKLALDSFSEDELQLLIDIQREYGKYTASTLVDLTHEKGSPWEQIYNGDHNHKVISPNSMKAYFSKQAPLSTFDTQDIERKGSVGYRDPSDGFLVLPAEYNDEQTL